MNVAIDNAFESTLADAIEDKIDNIFEEDSARSYLYRLALMQRIKINLSSTEIKVPDSLKKKYVERVEEDSTFSAGVVNQLWQDIVDAESNDCVLAMDDMVTESSFVEDALSEALSKVLDPKSVTLTSFFQALSAAFGKRLTTTVNPCPDYDYNAHTVPLAGFCKPCYIFTADVNTKYGHLGECQLTVVPVENLAWYLAQQASCEGDPDDLTGTWLKHIHLCADDDTIRQDVKAWIDENRDEAVEVIIGPTDFGWTKFGGTDVLVIQD